MITEDYVSFETAKLLKEKGFDESTSMVYMPYGDLCKLHRYDSIRNSNYNDITKNYFEYTAPTIQMAMKWLREEHSIIIIVESHIFNPQEARTTRFRFSVWVEDNYEEPYFDDPEHQFDSFSTYENTCDVAIKYCLENLVKV